MKRENIWLKLAFLVFILVIPLACKQLGSLAPNSNGGGTPTTSATPFQRSLDISEGRSLTYAGVRFTLTKAVISNREPNDRAPGGSNPALADVSFAVVNTFNEGVAISGGRWQLKLGDGTVYQRPYSVNFDARDTKDSMISFSVPTNAEWKGAQLTLDEPDREPAILALDGAATPQPYPTKLSPGGEAATKGPAMTYKILVAALDVDGSGQRAALGKRFLNLTVRVASQETSGGGGMFIPEYFRLMIDGVPRALEHMSDNNIVEGQSSQDVTLSFVIPASATKVELEVGKTGVQETARIPLDLTAPAKP
jgi:hypothetical protein